MYVDTSILKRHGQTYVRHLLRESYREQGRVLHRTIANLSQCSAHEVEAIRLALRHKHQLSELGVAHESIALEQGSSIGAVWVLNAVAKKLGIVEALGGDSFGKLALWQVIARVMDQGSRLSATRLARSHAVGEVLGLARFDEDDLYANLDELCIKQSTIEDALFIHRKKAVHLFLYDVTSSYLEGEHNALAAYGYNRDGKKGKKQIVVGLLCDSEGEPLTVEVFRGNTQDTKTLASQIKKAQERFGAVGVTFVGDRGMIKSAHIEELTRLGFHHITAITKPQIEKLLNEGAFQMELFDQALAEVTLDDGERYVLRKNPARAQQIAKTREEKLFTLNKTLQAYNDYLANHPRAKPETYLKLLTTRSTKLGLHKIVSFSIDQRTLLLHVDPSKQEDTAKLDGCYVLKTDLSKKQASKEQIHERYKDLALVEQAFRSIKTAHLEIRPIYLRREERTRAHAFVVMLAYKIIRHLQKAWAHLDLTVQEGIQELTSVCLTQVKTKNTLAFYSIPTPRASIQALLKALDLPLPKAINITPAAVSTKKKLIPQRKSK